MLLNERMCELICCGGRQTSGSMDLDVTNPKLLNRKVFLKQLAVDLCTSERRMLFRAQYVSVAFHTMFLYKKKERKKQMMMMFLLS